MTDAAAAHNLDVDDNGILRDDAQDTGGIFLDEDGILIDDEDLYAQHFTQRTGTDSGLGLHEQPPSQASTQNNNNKMADNRVNYLSISQPTQDASCDDSHPMEEKSLHVSDFEDSLQEEDVSHRSLQSAEESELVYFNEQDSPSTSKLGSLRHQQDEEEEFLGQPYHAQGQQPLVFQDVGDDEEDNSMLTESNTDSRHLPHQQDSSNYPRFAEDAFTQNDLTNQSATQQRNLSLLEFENLESHLAAASDSNQAPDPLMEYLQSSRENRTNQGTLGDSEDVIHAVYEEEGEEEEDDFSESSHEQKSEGSRGSSRQSRLDTFKSDQDGRNTASSLGQQTSAKTVINMYEDNLDNSFDDSIAQVSGASGFFMTETRESTPSPSKIPVYSRNSPSTTPAQSRSRSRSHSSSRVNSRPNTPHSGRNTPSRIPKWTRSGSPQAPPVSQSNSRTGSPSSRPWSRNESPLRAETPSKIPVLGERSSRPTSRSNTPVGSRRGGSSPKTSTPSTPVKGLKSGSSSRIPSPKFSKGEPKIQKSHSQMYSRPRSSDSQRSGYRSKKSSSDSRPDSGSSRRSGYSSRGRGSPKLSSQTKPKTSYSETRADEPYSSSNRGMFTQANREAYMQKQPQGISHADSHNAGPAGDFWSKSQQRQSASEPEYTEENTQSGNHYSAKSEQNSEFDEEENATRESLGQIDHGAPGFPLILPDKPLKPSKTFKVRHSSGVRGRTNRPLRVMSDRSSGEHDEIMSISSDASKGQLTARLKEEKTQRKHTDELVHQLQNDYDKLLEKYALAEVTIDQLRLGAKIHLHSDPPEASRSYQGVVPAPQRLQVFDIPKTSRATMGVIGTGPQKAQLSVGQSPGDATMQSPKQHDSSNDTSGLDGNSSLTATTSGESWKLALTFQAKGLEDKLNSFEMLLNEHQLEPAEQELVYNKIRSEFDKLQQDYRAAKENHEQMRRQGTLASGGTNMDFDEDKEMEGELFKLGMKLEAIGERVEEDLDSRPSSRVPFQEHSHRHSSHGGGHGHHNKGQGHDHHKQGHGHSPPRSRTSSTSVKQKKKPSKVESVTDTLDAPVEPVIGSKLQQLQEEYRALIDRYDRLKRLPRTPDRDREISQLIEKIQELSKESPRDFPLPLDLQKSTLPRAEERQYNSSSPDGYHYTDSSSPPGPTYKNHKRGHQGQDGGSYSSVPDSGMSTPIRDQQPMKMQQPRQRSHDDVDSGFVGSESSRQSLLPGQHKMNLGRGSKVHARQRVPQTQVQEEQPQWAESVESGSDATSVQPRKRESRGTSTKRASSRQRPQSSKSSKSHDSMSSKPQSSKRSRHSSSRSSQRPSSQLSMLTESDAQSSVSMVSSTSSRRSTRLQSLHEEIAKMKESLLNWTESQRQSVLPPPNLGKENVYPKSDTESRHSRHTSTQPKHHTRYDARGSRDLTAPSHRQQTQQGTAGRGQHQPGWGTLRREDLEGDYHSGGFDADQRSNREPEIDRAPAHDSTDMPYERKGWTGSGPQSRYPRHNTDDYDSSHRPSYQRYHDTYRPNQSQYEEDDRNFQDENGDYDNDPHRLRKYYDYYIPRSSGLRSQEGPLRFRQSRDQPPQPPDYHSMYRSGGGVPPLGEYEDSPHRPQSHRMTRSELGGGPGVTGVKTVACPLCGGSGYHTHTEQNYVYQPQPVQPAQPAPAVAQPVYAIQQPSVPQPAVTLAPLDLTNQQQPVYLQPVTPVQQQQQQTQDQQQQQPVYLQPVTPVQQKPMYLQPVTPVVMTAPMTSTPAVPTTPKVRYYVKEYGDNQSSSRSTRKSHRTVVSDIENEYDSELEDSLREATRSARKLKKITGKMRGDVKDDLSRSLRYSTLLA
ncbi:uncharacterized protein LOC106172953 isoform X2 [Lingula anatina]|uniref:Uncharacterized protein LOC106172953 isoform X2 n=1 Tax=Lingula anatina TaxID=7574 RepID=A0A2R2MQ43_LINAN|nr:uncharacterized protein LOC106172953 isoform X2 [Lingula anatina]|eukprot:XP_023932364.1 uncharacterized protein LOC106172953 isoform X2 [Lingula anatina]